MTLQLTLVIICLAAAPLVAYLTQRTVLMRQRLACMHAGNPLQQEFRSVGE